MADFIRFYNGETGKELCRISIDGYFKGELKATRELLACEHKIPIRLVRMEAI